MKTKDEVYAQITLAMEILSNANLDDQGNKIFEDISTIAITKYRNDGTWSIFQGDVKSIAELVTENGRNAVDFFRIVSKRARKPTFNNPFRRRNNHVQVL